MLLIFISGFLFGVGIERHLMMKRIKVMQERIDHLKGILEAKTAVGKFNEVVLPGWRSEQSARGSRVMGAS
jgi:2-iminoacetate synthase ThiH